MPRGSSSEERKPLLDSPTSPYGGATPSAPFEATDDGWHSASQNGSDNGPPPPYFNMDINCWNCTSPVFVDGSNRTGIIECHKCGRDMTYGNPPAGQRFIRCPICRRFMTCPREAKKAKCQHNACKKKFRIDDAVAQMERRPLHRTSSASQRVSRTPRRVSMWRRICSSDVLMAGGVKCGCGITLICILILIGMLIATRNFTKYFKGIDGIILGGGLPSLGGLFGIFFSGRSIWKKCRHVRRELDEEAQEEQD